ncbi:Hypothetical protein PHPALM_7083, partial [Phytophthora palmivora]
MEDLAVYASGDAAAACSGVHPHPVDAHVPADAGSVEAEETSDRGRDNVDASDSDNFDDSGDEDWTPSSQASTPPPPNVEKSESMYHNIRPYIPEEFRDDPLYAKPSVQENLDAKAAKQARRAHRAAMAVAAKKNWI